MGRGGGGRGGGGRGRRRKKKRGRRKRVEMILSDKWTAKGGLLALMYVL